jgi:ElaA protein
MSSPLWKWKKFNELSILELYEIMVIRQVVFSVEQNCVYLDADGYDQNAWHLFSWDEGSQKVTSYLRVLPAGVKYEEPAIGRVVTSPDHRGLGLGKLLMIEALKNIEHELGKTPIRISAQSYLEKFYTELGFSKIGEPYLEDNIPHIEMLRKS